MKSRLLKCLVVDDEPLAAALISGYVERTPFLQLVKQVNSAAEAMQVLADQTIDLIFMDIRMPGMSGMELAEILPEHTRVIFITAFADYALEGFNVKALHYLLKPVSYPQFLQAANRALEPDKVSTGSGSSLIDEFLTVKSEYRIVRIPFSDILYVEGLKDYVKIFVEGKPQPILSLMSMKSVEESLQSDNFMRVHRSYIVNLSKIRLVERNCILMGGAVIPVSDSYRAAFNSRLGL